MVFTRDKKTKDAVKHLHGTTNNQGKPFVWQSDWKEWGQNFYLLIYSMYLDFHSLHGTIWKLRLHSLDGHWAVFKNEIRHNPATERRVKGCAGVGLVSFIQTLTSVPWDLVTMLPWTLLLMMNYLLHPCHEKECSPSISGWLIKRPTPGQGRRW